MKISDLFKNGGLNSLRSPVNQEETEDKSKVIERAQVAGEDQVSISPAARQMQRMQAILAEDENNRELKIADLKEKVNSGSYSFDSQQVAASIVNFARDSQLSS